MAYLDAIEDAAAVGDLADKLDQSHYISLRRISEEITELLTVSVTKVQHKFLRVPFCTYRDSPCGRIDTHAIETVVADEVQSGKPLDALMAVIASSNCPFVANLRKAIAASYIDGNASEIAEMTA